MRVTARMVGGLVLGLMLAACADQAPEIWRENDIPPLTQPDTCGLEQQLHLIGKPIAGYDRTRATGPVRIMGPNAVMTLDHNPLRINIVHDASGKVTRLSCG